MFNLELRYRLGSRTKWLMVVISLLVVGMFGPSFVQADSTGNVNLLLGAKNLDEDDWEPLEQHTEAGIEVDFRSGTWPVNIVIGVLGSQDDGTMQVPGVGTIDIEAVTSEFYFGLKKIFDQSPMVRPYLGFGLANVYAEAEGSTMGIKVSEDDSALGLWFGGGVYFTLAKNLNLGVNLRYSKAEVNLAGVDGEAGGFHYHLLIGYHW